MSADQQPGDVAAHERRCRMVLDPHVLAAAVLDWAAIWQGRSPRQSDNAEELALALDMALSIGRRQPDPARFGGGR